MKTLVNSTKSSGQLLRDMRKYFWEFLVSRQTPNSSNSVNINIYLIFKLRITSWEFRDLSSI